jgi:hypothetical protein
MVPLRESVRVSRACLLLLTCDGGIPATMFWSKNAVDSLLWDKKEKDGKKMAVWQSMISGFLATCPGMVSRCTSQGRSRGEGVDADSYGAICSLFCSSERSSSPTPSTSPRPAS